MAIERLFHDFQITGILRAKLISSKNDPESYGTSASTSTAITTDIESQDTLTSPQARRRSVMVLL